MTALSTEDLALHTPLIPKNQYAVASEDQVYAEDSIDGMTATYRDKGRWRVEIEYDSALRHTHVKKLFNGQPARFQSREDMLTYENGRRLKERAHLPESEKYQGFQRNPINTTGMNKTLSLIIAFISKPLTWLTAFFI